MNDPLAELRGRFVDRLRSERAELLALAAAGDRNSEELRRLAHGLAGSAGTFGFPSISAAALEIDDVLAAGGSAEPAQLDALRREMDAAITG